ncbi:MULTISPECIES: glycosyltransferase [Methylopila]|uniref:Glycosyltransferase 2-like domain-containing protein n=2 Tax=Methylopila TaxID=61653 RepID=A0A9W6N7D1_9HYPH|nr:glycosyltransferase [Methylopila turkensis]GLK80305.1 hypothetical protein GCM10008174_20460 [Methylopila turkensis]
MTTTDSTIPPVTFIIEWENAIDVEDEWAKKAMSSFQNELETNQHRMAAKPRIMYLYDDGAVQASTIQGVIDEVAPKLKDLATLEIVPAPGMTYYKLKNFGVSRTDTELVVMLDSDAGPQPGWLENLLKPFADPEIMAVGGFTVLGHEDLLSKTMALSWIFNLPSERTKTEKRKKIHANNCAFRTEFFRRNPFPDLPGAFKKQCGFWLRDIEARGYKYVRTADAMTVHAPHPGYKFLAWRAWTTGMDRDFQAFHTVTQSRLGRLGYSFKFFASKLSRSWSRILSKGDEVDLPVWQRPIAMALSFAYFFTALLGELSSAATRSFGPLPKTGNNEPPRAIAHGHG